MTDHRTLRLAHLQLTQERVAALVKYQSTVARHLGEPGHDGWAGHLAFAHAAGLKESGLDAQDARKLSAVAADYCGRRLQVRRLEQRLADAKAKVASGKASKKDADLAARIPGELNKVGDFSAFASLHGPDALANVQAREAELLELHEKLARLEGEGHLHRG
jgi:hypothetical protein